MKNVITLLLLCSIWSLSAQNEKVSFSQSGGCYHDSFALSLTCDNPNHHIRYTLNGSTPSANSALYAEPLLLNSRLYSNSDIYKIPISPDKYVFVPDTILKAIVIRAAVFDADGNRLGDVATNSYFIQSLGCDFQELPIMSICADSSALFDYDTGIFVPGANWSADDPEWTGNYYQTGKDWERRIHVEYYDANQLAFSQDAGLRAHGGNGRRLPQKNMTLYAKDDYGKKNFTYKIYEDLDLAKFKHLVLKPFVSSWTEAGVQDYVSSHIAKNLNIDVLASRPVILFLNGEYWGIYFLQEKSDERYVEEHYDVDADDCNIIESCIVADNGDFEPFGQLMQWFETADLSTYENYQYAENHIDLSNFTDYQIFEIFSNNEDWPANNQRCWQAYDLKWRWIFYDGDATLHQKDFDCFANATYDGIETWPASKESTLFLRKLLGNKTFKDNFIQRFCTLCNSTFSYQNTKPYLLAIKNQIQNEINRQSSRFGIPADQNNWKKGLNHIDKFLKERPQNIIQSLRSFFYLNKEIDIQNLICFPNPSFGNEISVKFTGNEPNIGKINIYDILGNCVFSDNIIIEEGENIQKIGTHLKAGTYIVNVGNQSVKIICGN